MAQTLRPTEENVKSGNAIDEMFEDFSNFYASGIPLESKPKCVIPANNKFKIYFDLVIMGSLMFTATVVPFRLAFASRDS